MNVNYGDYKRYFFDTVEKLLKTPSPTGYGEQIEPLIRSYAENLGLDYKTNNKYSMIMTIPGKSHERAIGISAHCDTLGAMVRSITAKGEIMFTAIGGVCFNNLDGEYCSVHTREGKDYRATILTLSPSVHVFPDASSRPRDDANMYIRLDEKVHNAEDVAKLGICPGDYVFFDTKTEIVNDFLKSRFIDDKGSVAICLTLAKIIKDTGFVPDYDLKIFFDLFEEVGHGAAVIPENIFALLAIDMGCVGLDLTGNEYKVSICAKDSGGPYDYGFTNFLIDKAKALKLDYAVDIFPRYGSDIGAMWHGGHDVRGALIGSGVQASHGLERTHFDGVLNTVKLALAYVENASELIIK